MQMVQILNYVSGIGSTEQIWSMLLAKHLLTGLNAQNCSKF